MGVHNISTAGDALTWETNSVLGTLLSSLPSEVPVLTSSPSTTSRGSSPTTLGSTSGSGVQRAWPSSSFSSTSCSAAYTRSTGTPGSPATGSSSQSSFCLPRTRLLSTSNMFTYWPFISLIVAAVMVTILLVLKFSEKLCRARLRSPHRHGGHPDQHPMDDLEMMEDGQGTMMDFNLQDSGSVRSQRTAHSQVGYSPASETGYQHREMAL